MMYHTLIIGSGCAGFNAADWLYDLGVTDIAIVTEGVGMGTSRNTGSDKQTYYKLALAGEGADSVYEMAQTLYSGGSVHGDTALIEAACSAKAFMKLVHLGVPFPTNRYGAYVGYQTDHDEAKRQRATSCGPLTSKLMTEALESSVNRKGIPIINDSQVVEILTDNDNVTGIVLLDKTGYRTLHCQNIILATGGPAGIYADVVFPKSQTGGTGLALAAGATACNLQEWQYGLASIDFRWNVSGTYQQVLPRYISVDETGNEHEFLPDYFDTPEEALDMVFLKGYQWPFDALKINGSSKIDQIVAHETNEKGRNVYMDYRQNPTGLNFDKLAKETYDYLANSNALFGTPIERLEKMNPKAIELYKSNGIDLYSQPLRIAVCAQHCNGGIAVDENWETNIKGLYVVGEAAGTFGVYRPGGSALNATQVGSMRAAEHIANKARHCGRPKTTPISAPMPKVRHCGLDPQSQTRMSRYAAYTRNTSEMQKLHAELCTIRDNYHTSPPHFANLAAYSSFGFCTENLLRISNGSLMCVSGRTPEKHCRSPKCASRKFSAHLIKLLYHKNYDILLTQIAVLSAMIFSAQQIGSRGGAIVNGAPVNANAASFNDKVILTTHKGSAFAPVRPLPKCDDWFENVWNK